MTRHPKLRLRRCFLLMNSASRICAYRLILLSRWAECPYLKYAAQPRRNPFRSSAISSRPQQQPAPPGQFPDTVAGMLHGPVRGPAGQERHPRFFPFRPRERTSRW